MMLTGCRPGEWSACLRPYIDLKQKLLVIPADAYKSDHVHVVPLVPHAIEILEDVLSNHRGASGEHIFSGTDGKKRVAGWSKAKARMTHAICAMTGDKSLAPWTPHDLRRTVATRIAEQLGIGGEQLIKRVLGHSDGSVTAIYNRYGYVKEMRAVLETWAADLTAASNVMSLHPRSSDVQREPADTEPLAARAA
jgi:integrase